MFRLLLFVPCVLAALNYKDFYIQKTDAGLESEYLLMQRLNQWISDNNISIIQIETFVAPYPDGLAVPFIWNELQAVRGNGESVQKNYYLTFTQVKRLWYLSNTVDESNYSYDDKNITLYINSAHNNKVSVISYLIPLLIGILKK